MTEPLFFDTDGISAFLWVEEQSILAQMYPGRIVIPKPVYDEMSFPCVRHLRDRIDRMIKNGQAVIREIETNTDTYELYYQMTESPSAHHKIIGRGEAACLALAKTDKGIIASNNLKDISDYINELDLRHKTTGDIMIEAFRAGIITEEQGNLIWASMLCKRRKIGASTFSEYLEKNKYYSNL